MNFTKKYLWLVVSLSSFAFGSANADNVSSLVNEGEKDIKKTEKDIKKTEKNSENDVKNFFK